MSGASGSGVAMMSEVAKKLLDEPNVAVLATLHGDGRPQTTAVWVGRSEDDSHLLVATQARTVKHRNVESDPRVGLTVFNREEPYEELNVQGRVVGTEPGEPVLDRLSESYYGKTPYPLYKQGDEWIALQIAVNRWRTNR